MVTKIQSWGNSQGIRLTKQVLAESHISVGDDVDLTVDDGIIMIAPVKRIRGGHSLKDLVAQIPDDYEPEEVNWGEPAGKEAW